MVEPLPDLILSLIARGYDAPREEKKLDEILLAATRFQWERSQFLRKITPRPAEDWREIPLIPTRLFSLHAVTAFPLEKAVAVFESSGTTGTLRSRHYFCDLALYRAASMEGARRGAGSKSFRFRSLVEDSDSSSLARMARWMSEEWPGVIDTDTPVLLLGTAFSFVNLIDAGSARPLPPESVVVETGGYKGRSREITRGELRTLIADEFEVPREMIISEYGMCELSSPFWQKTGAGNEKALFPIPSWIRVRIVDPETLEDAKEGLIALYDPANLHSSVGILTGDRGRLEEGRLELLGRLPGIEKKGCSLTA